MTHEASLWNFWAFVVCSVTPYQAKSVDDLTVSVLDEADLFC